MAGVQIQIKKKKGEGGKEKKKRLSVYLTLWTLAHPKNSGNSYTQTGFDINGAKASQANPLGNPDLPGWTTTGGLNWVGQLVTTFNNGVVYSYNFADGGATVDASIVPPYTETVKSLADQVENYSGTLGTKPDYAPWTPENAIVAVWIGVNDVGNSWYQPDAQDIATRVVARYFELLQDIYATGIRQFALLNVPREFRSFCFSSFTPNASFEWERGPLSLPPSPSPLASPSPSPRLSSPP